MLGATLMITQSFLYNATFFTYTLVLSKFYGVSSSNAPIYLIGAGVMILGGVVELVLGIPAERRPLEAVARPLSLVPATAVPTAAGSDDSVLSGPARDGAGIADDRAAKAG